MKNFIVFFKCENKTGHSYGNTGFRRVDSLPSYNFIRNHISNGRDFSEGQINITSITKVDDDDYNGFFDLKSEGLL